jgi:hypothetical protein
VLSIKGQDDRVGAVIEVNTGTWREKKYLLFANNTDGERCCWVMGTHLDGSPKQWPATTPRQLAACLADPAFKIALSDNH